MLYRSPSAVVLIDPLLPPDPEELWPALDECVDGQAVVVLTTIR